MNDTDILKMILKNVDGISIIIGIACIYLTIIIAGIGAAILNKLDEVKEILESRNQ